MKELQYHGWPDPGEHLWSEWMSDRPRQGTQPATQYRKCCHPRCGAWERREAPMS